MLAAVGHDQSNLALNSTSGVISRIGVNPRWHSCKRASQSVVITRRRQYLDASTLRRYLMRSTHLDARGRGNAEMRIEASIIEKRLMS